MKVTGRADFINRRSIIEAREKDDPVFIIRKAFKAPCHNTGFVSAIFVLSGILNRSLSTRAKKKKGPP
jgi:hypothetical protein